MSSDVVARLLAWLQRHPLKRSPSTKQAAYTDEVMARVRASAPAPVLQWVLRPTAAALSSLLRECRSRLALRPRAAFGFGTAIAFGLAVMVFTHRAPARVANDAEYSSQVLAELGELNGVSGNELEDETVVLDRLVLAEADMSTDDDVWIQETAQLLDEVGDSSAQASDEDSLEELLRELESLDESEIASS